MGEPIRGQVAGPRAVVEGVVSEIKRFHSTRANVSKLK